MEAFEVSKDVGNGAMSNSGPWLVLMRPDGAPPDRVEPRYQLGVRLIFSSPCAHCPLHVGQEVHDLGSGRKRLRHVNAATLFTLTIVHFLIRRKPARVVTIPKRSNV